MGDIKDIILCVIMGLLIWSIIYAVAESEKRQHELLMKYPECVTVGNPYICTKFKESINER